MPKTASRPANTGTTDGAPPLSAATPFSTYSVSNKIAKLILMSSNMIKSGSLLAISHVVRP